VAVLALGEAGYAILMLKYFLLIPIVAHSCAAICLAMAFITAGFVKKEVA
jgi:hypothetical protein